MYIELGFYDDKLKNLKNNTDFSPLEFAVLNNCFKDVEFLISQKEKIYYNLNLLCNGFMNRHFNNHPNSCVPKICYRTALCIAMRNNYRAYTTLFILMKILSSKYALPEINLGLNEMGKIICDCKEKTKYLKGYKDNYLSFRRVHKIMCRILPRLVWEFRKYDTNAELRLIKLDVCVHTLLQHDSIRLEKDDITELESLFLSVERWYQENVLITILLLNQQFIELNQYSLDNDLDKIKLLYKDDNLYIRDNFTELYKLYVKNEHGDKVLNYLISKKLIKIINNTDILELINEKHYETYFSLIETNKEIMNLCEHIMFKIISDNTLNIYDKTRYIKILIDNGYDINEMMYDEDILMTTLRVANSLPIIKMIIKKIKIITNKHIIRAIELNREDVIDILIPICKNIDISCLRSSVFNNRFLDKFSKLEYDITLDDRLLYDSLNNSQAISILLNKGYSSNFIDENDDTLVMRMIKLNLIEGIEKIITEDNINKVNKCNQTVLMLILDSKYPFEYLSIINKTSFNLYNHKDNNDMDILGYVLNMYGFDKLRFLTNIADKYIISEDKLIRCVEKNEFRIVKMFFNKLIEQGKIILIYNEQPVSEFDENMKCEVKSNYETSIDVMPLIYNYLVNNYNQIKKQRILSFMFDTILIFYYIYCKEVFEENNEII